jgi:hypothetical protein
MYKQKTYLKIDLGRQAANLATDESSALLSAW